MFWPRRQAMRAASRIRVHQPLLRMPKVAVIQHNQMSPRTVLLVDDDPGTVMTFALSLRASGCRVLTADNGHDAIRMTEAGAPDVIVCDLNLPDLSGVDVCRTIRRAGIT